MYIQQHMQTIPATIWLTNVIPSSIGPSAPKVKSGREQECPALPLPSEGAVEENAGAAERARLQPRHNFSQIHIASDPEGMPLPKVIQKRLGRNPPTRRVS